MNVPTDRFSSPRFSARSSSDYRSFMINPSSETSCAHEYRVKLTDNMGNGYEGTTSDVEDFQSGVDLRNVLEDAEDVNICKHNYTIEVEGILDGVSQTTTVQPSIDYSGK